MHALLLSILLVLSQWTLSNESTGISCPANVPSTVAGTLIDNGIPFEDKTIFDTPWTYTCNFGLDPISLKKHHRLRFDGISYRADITINGHVLATSDTTAGVFIIREFDVTPYLKENNVLQVKVLRAQKGDLNIGFVDWNPRPEDESMGIVRDVNLYQTGDVAITDIFVKPDLHLSDMSADLTVEVTLHNYGKKRIKGSIRGTWTEDDFSAPVTLAPGETRVVTLTSKECEALHSGHPAIWWPREMGKPAMHTMVVRFETRDKISDFRSTSFGIRRIESEIDSEGHLQFILNGRKVLIKGAGWTDDRYLLDTPRSLDIQTDLVLNMGLNCIRFENIWGKDHTIYDLCDRKGILALVGFSCQWEWEEYCGLPQGKDYGCINDPVSMDLAARYFADQVRWLRNHPSVIGWMTGSDRTPNPELEKRYLDDYHRLDYRPYICSAKNLTSPLSGPSGTKMEGPYEYVAPDYWYLDTRNGGAFGFNTETGIGSNWPQLETIKKMIPDVAARWPLSSAYDRYCTASASAMNNTAKLQESVDAQYGPSADLETFVRKAHALDYDGTRAMFEAFRCNLPHTTGIVQWMLNSACPSLYWQLYDHDLNPTAGYYGVKKACESIQLIFNYKDYKVYAVNETGNDVTVNASLKLFAGSSEAIGEASAKVTVRDRQPEPVFSLDTLRGRAFFAGLNIAGGADNFYCIPATLTEYDETKSNWYITPASKYSDLSFVTSLPETVIKYNVTISEGEGTRTWKVKLINDSDVIAYQNVLKLITSDDTLASPVFWSDNFVTLLPGETKVITATAPEGVDGTVHIAPWNARIEILDDGSRDRSKYATEAFSEDDRYHVETPYETVYVNQVHGDRIKNVIVMIGDGMGIPHISCGWILNGGRLNMDNFKYTGMSRTWAADKLITDSCAGGSAIATGEKTNYGHMGYDTEGNVVENSLKKAQSLGKKTGIIVTCRINDATPLDFCGHSKDRNDEEANAAQYIDSGIDFITGGGIEFWQNRTDGRDLIEEMKARGYTFATSTEGILEAGDGKILALLADTEMDPALERGDYLEKATMKAIRNLDNERGFFLMVEGSMIDDWSHRNKVGYMAEELFDFDRTIGKVLEWAEKDGETLVVVTADHNTGGLTILGGSLDERSVKVHFSTRGHNDIMVPVMAYGPHAEEFVGMMDNSEVGKKIKNLVK